MMATATNSTSSEDECVKDSPTASCFLVPPRHEVQDSEDDGHRRWDEQGFHRLLPTTPQAPSHLGSPLAPTVVIGDWLAAVDSSSLLTPSNCGLGPGVPVMYVPVA